MNIDTLQRTRLVLTCAALWAASTCAHADATLDKIKQRGRIIVGVMISGGPFGAIDPATQRFVGWNPELARDLARRLGVELEAVQVLPSNRVQFLQAGKVDALIAGMEVTPERAEILDYAHTPHYRVGGTAATLKASGIQRWEDLRGKPVCLSQGSSYAKPLTEQYGALVKGFKSSSESLLALRGNNCVAAVHDTVVVYPLLRTNAEWKDYAAPLPELNPAPSVIWVRKGEMDTAAAIDKVVQDWHRSGWLIATEARLGIAPANPVLQELHAQYKADKAVVNAAAR